MKLKGIKPLFPATQYLTSRGLFTIDPFVLIDIGCSGGIDRRWRIFGDDLRAYGIDPVIMEVEKHRSKETLKGVHYWAGYINLPDEHPIRKERETIGPWGNNTWDRLSAAWANQILPRKADDEGWMSLYRWEKTQLAPRNCLKTLDDFVKINGISNVDFIKVDIDGNDLYAIMSGDDLLRSGNVIGIQIEVNFFGTPCNTDNTFHNTDRIMRGYGFELFNLTMRRYSRRHLPAPFLMNLPAQTEWGAPLQGDALYMLDLAGQPRQGVTNPRLVEKLLKLIAAFEIMKLPDCAAELVLTYSELLAGQIDLERLLDLLTPPLHGKKISYHEYIGKFASDPTQFYPRPLSKRQKIFYRIARFLTKLDSFGAA